MTHEVMEGIDPDSVVAEIGRHFANRESNPYLLEVFWDERCERRHVRNYGIATGCVIGAGRALDVEEVYRMEILIFQCFSNSC